MNKLAEMGYFKTGKFLVRAQMGQFYAAYLGPRAELGDARSYFSLCVIICY